MGNSIFDLIYSCFNQYLFQEAKNNIQELEYFFKVNPATSGSPLIDELVKAIKTYPLESIDEPLFRSILMKSGKSPVEQQQVMGEIIKWKKYGRDQIVPARKMLQDVCSSVIIQRAQRLYQDNPTEYIKYLKNINLQTSDRETLNAISLNNIDINSIIAEQANSIMPSKYHWINETFPNGGIERQEVLLVSFPPGSGKSLFALNEAAYSAANGYNVLYFAMGDLSYKDQLVRLAAITVGCEFREAYHNLGSIYNAMSGIYKDHLDLSIVPANVYTVEDFKEFVMNSKKKYDLIIVDYDSNFKCDQAGENMYLAYGEIYSVLVEISRILDCIVMVLGQPRIGTWSNPIIELADVGESSRKQHSVDFCLTRSKVPGCPNNLGVFYIAKSRRGAVGRKVYNIRLNNGRFIELPKGLFDKLKEDTEERNYTEGQIQMLIQQYNQQFATIQQQVQSNYKQVAIKPGSNPFN